MTSNSIRNALAQFDITGDLIQVKSLSGGCINEVLFLELDNGKKLVLKYNSNQALSFFKAEEDGLNILQNTGTIAVPYCFGTGTVKSINFILLEYHAKEKGISYWEEFGQALAALHQHTTSYFGLEQDNFIGALNQPNKPKESWREFYLTQRLEVQKRLMQSNGLWTKAMDAKLEKLYLKLDDLLPDNPPSLIHGDLWGGNVITSNSGKAMVIDPAVYYADREIELAFTQLFGGFPQTFYQAYQEAFPLEAGYNERIKLYQLYPLMVHANLFGGSYVTSVERNLDWYVS